MRVYADFSTYLSPGAGQSPVVQVEKVPVMGEEGRAVINGRFLLPMPLDVDFPIVGLLSGAFTSVTSAGSSSVYLHCSANHGLVMGAIVTITGTGDYDGRWPVSSILSDTAFEIPVTFVVTRTGAWQSGDYVVNAAGNIDGYDIVSQGMARLLAAFPMFGNIYFNPLLTADHVAELDFTSEFSDPSGNRFKPRFQTGREPAGDSGVYPTHTALLPQNNLVTPARPGLMVTNAIDIGPYTLDCDNEEVGTDEFMLWWKLYEFDVSHDVTSNFGATAGLNEPAVRSVGEMDNEPAGFFAYLSIDGGANWCAVGLMEPVSFCTKTKSVMIAFKNTSDTKRYIASFALLF